MHWKLNDNKLVIVTKKKKKYQIINYINFIRVIFRVC